jgi:hypothetical protein
MAQIHTLMKPFVYASLIPLLGLYSLTLKGQNATAVLDGNDVRAVFQANGLLAFDHSLGAPYYRVPASLTGPSPIYAGTIWIGGLDADSVLHFAGERFEQEGLDFFPGPLGTNAGISQATSDAYNTLWKVNRSDVYDHIAYFNCLNDPDCNEQVEYPGYTTPTYFYTWPAHGDTDLGQAPDLADYIDYNNDGNYNPDDGDAPCIPGDQALLSIYNDNLAPHTESGGQPIGLEVHFTPFAFTGVPAINQTVFIRYRFFNRSSTPLYNTYIALWNDYDLGGSNDDFLQCDVGRNLFFVFNADQEDEGADGHAGYGANPPAFGETILQGPLMDPDGVDNTDTLALPGYNGTGFGDGIADNERLGMTYAIYQNNSTGPMGDPITSDTYYNFLRGRWRDGTPMSYGGSGYSTDSTAVPAHFMFPGTSDPLGVGTNGQVMPAWTEVTAGNAPGDRRGLSSIGPFTFLPGQEQDLLVAYVYARDNNGSVDALLQRVDSVRAFAETQPGLLAPGSPCDGLMTAGIASLPASIPALKAYPNPATTLLTVQLPVTALNNTLQVIDAHGTVVLEQKANKETVYLGIGALAPGLYLLRSTGTAVTRPMRFVKN